MSQVRTKYIYKVYRDGEYLGLLRNVKSEYEEVLQINTAGSSIKIDIGTSPDDTVSEFGNILSEASDLLTSESDEELVYQETTTVFGPETLLDVNNEIKVFEFSEYEPNGEIVFNGYISTIDPNFGGGENIQVTVLSYGQELDNFIIEAGENLLTDQSAQSSLWGFGDIHGSDIQAVAQSFSITSETIISKIAIYMQSLTTLNLTFRLYSGSSPDSGSLLASFSQSIVAGALAYIDFTLPSAINAVPGTYCWELDSGSPPYGTERFWVGSAGSSVYSGGEFLTSTDPGSDPFDPPFTADDATFRIYETTGSTTAVYNSQDPSDILRSIVADQNARGGRMSYDVDSIDDTGEVVSYTFKVNTTLEGIKKVRELGPSDWFWYGDVAENMVHYHQKSETTEHTIILGRHINELNLQYTLENIKTVVYFSGGDIGGGVNLFKKYTNSEAIEAYGIRLARISDNRVTLDATADALAADILDNNSVPAYRTTVTIPASKYELRTFALGDMVNFGNTNNPNIDALLLQIVQIRRNADRAVLSLDTVPPRASRRIEDIRRNLDKLQTIDNPDAPE